MIDEADRREMTEALLTYCRGIDRLDAERVRAAFVPGAELEGYGPDVMTIETFAEYALASLGRSYRATQHRVSNIFVEETGDGARLEAYVLASHHAVGTDGESDTMLTFAGRYIDTMARHDGGWRIARRILRHDWSTLAPVTSAARPTWIQSGRAGSPDPLDS